MMLQAEALDLLKKCWPDQSAEWYTENILIVVDWLLTHDMKLVKELTK